MGQLDKLCGLVRLGHRRLDLRGGHAIGGLQHFAQLGLDRDADDVANVHDLFW